MWLASISRRDPITKRPHNAKDWTERQRARADQILDVVLRDVGDDTRERSFSMCLTHCRHRAVSDAELARLPESWACSRPRSLAGGPLVVHWTRGVTPTLSADPCDRVTLAPHPKFGAMMPVECGFCPPCKARAIVERTGVPCTLSREELSAVA